MNILVVHEVSYEAKVAYEYQDFAERLAAMGHSVNVVDFDEHGDGRYHRKEYSKTGIGTVTLENTPFLNAPIVKYLSGRRNHRELLEGKLRNGEVDVVLLYSVFVNGTNTVRLCRKYGVPVVYRLLDVYHKIRQSPVQRLPLYLGERYIYNNADMVCSTNSKMEAYARETAGGKGLRQSFVLHHGVDTDFFFRREKDTQLAEKYGIEAGDRVALFLGTTYDFSGLDVVLEGFDQLRDLCPNVKVMIVGGGDLDPKLKALVSEKKLADRVVLTGMRPYAEVPGLLSLADCCFNSFFINDITRDIVPIKILQYLACGKPVVSSPIPDVVRLFPERESGMLYFDIADGEGFLSLLGRTLEDAEMRDELSEKAVDFIGKNFSMATQIRRLEGLLKSRLP